MLIKKLELENFRQYIGTQTIEFSDDPLKNVTLILGKNTSGKTTIIQAFRWVLYNDCNFTGKRSDEKAVLNTEIRRSMRAGDERVARVSLTFEHQKMQYKITRKYIYHCKTSGDGIKDDEMCTMYYYPNGEQDTLKRWEGKLKEMIPESLSDYFFFDGEKIAKVRDQKNVKDSINTIMGLVPLEHMQRHLSGTRNNNVEDILRSKMRKDPNVNELNAKIDRAKAKLDEASRNEKQAKDRYNEFAELTEQQRVELAKVQDLATYASELKRIDVTKKLAQEKIKEIEVDIRNSFSKATMESMINLISHNILEDLSNANYIDKGIPGINATAVRYLIDRGQCICGNDLKNHDECRTTLIDLLSYLPPESIGTQITQLRKELSSMRDYSANQETFAANYASHLNQESTIDELEGLFNRLSEQVQGHRDADQINEAYLNSKKHRDTFLAQKETYASDVARLKGEIDGLENQLKIASKSDGFNKDIIAQVNYVKLLSARAREEYERNSQGIFEEVQKTLTTVFNSMYHGARTIELTPDYKVRLTVGGESLDNSKGLDTVQNFAFIATLLKVAKDRSDLELSAEAYPLAMDAVFSNTDENHIRNICKELPKLAEQAILAIMDKDWAIASESLNDRVGKRYRIEKISETRSEIKAIE